jgi:adenine-specific DNA-methyltransferase
MQNLLDDLIQLLQKDDRFTAEGKLLKNKVVEAALQLDPALLKLLLSNKTIKKHFFQEVDGINVFDKIKFQKFISNKSFLPDSYTSFKNKIGLTVDYEFISESKEVVLSWAYKDCVLEGGQTKEDEKRNEIFWNEILAPNEIDRLLSPKVLTNFKKYDSKGEHKVLDISLEDNLIIKGNNLLALHSLLPIYRGRIKLIYIDPPYNTGNDEFGYNDSFNHSTWLTFLKNRLEVAKALLDISGSIWINIDDNELSHLKVLCDEIFYSENILSIVSMKRSAPTGHKAINPSPISVTDFLLGYARDKKSWKYKIQYTAREYDKAYNQFIENYDEGYKKWRFIPLKSAMHNLGIADIDHMLENYSNQIVRFAIPEYDGVGWETRALIDESVKKPDRIFLQKRNGYSDIYLKNGQRILFYTDKLKEIDGEKVSAEPLTNFWNDIPFQGIAKEGNVQLRKGKKPEFLIKRLLEFSTNEGDLVLDYFLGSGTTCAVAHKLKRKYIGIEQLDYGKNDPISRLRYVIKGDTTGISKFVNWKGSGSFIYCELAEFNQQFINQINSSKTSKELTQIWETIKKDGFISYKVNPKEIDDNISEFEQLSLQDQKKFLIEVLDKNHLYVNYSEIDDKDYKILEEDKKLNKKFYSLK